MSLGPLRYYSDFLYPINTGAGTYPTAPVDNANIVITPSAAGFYMGFPVWLNMYPLSPEFNSLVLEWNLITLPSNATYVRLVPFSAKGLIVSGAQLVPGYYGEGSTVIGTAIAEDNRFSWDELDATNNKAVVHQYALEKDVTWLNVPTLHILPTIVPYIGFYIESDGDQNPDPGTHTLYAHMSIK